MRGQKVIELKGTYFRSRYSAKTISFRFFTCISFFPQKKGLELRPLLDFLDCIVFVK